MQTTADMDARRWLDAVIDPELRRAPEFAEARDRARALMGTIGLDVAGEVAEDCAKRLADAGDDPPLELREAAWDLLDLLRCRELLRRIAAAKQTAAWADRILALVERSHLTTGVLFRRHVEIYGPKVLFEIPAPGGSRSLSWRQTGARVEAIARGLLSLAEDSTAPRVAFVSDNRIEMALCDLACFSAGIVSVMIPANSTEADVGYMLRHARVDTVIASDREQVRKVVPNRESLPDLRHVIAMDVAASGRGVLSLDEISSRAGRVPVAEVERRALASRSGDLATVMFTSGTTGQPKGIRFAHRNIVFKRFARALALPEIGEDDVFLCYLPLFHTFGRFFEMMGSVFWGATYCFLENPSIEALVQGMRRHRPTIFISVPKKWIQLWDAIVAQAPPDDATDAQILEATRRLTGGRLRWGLSAAGYLDAEIFRFFQAQGVEFMSGFGMTEATGGITMTPPGEYRDDSLGVPLPGIETRLGTDGELEIRGPYVMLGYLDPPEGETDLDAEGWLRTGDLMERGSDGHYRMVDRKKEIYKNVKGETIAPQRIENLFRDFESVGRVFLVGDHREYNTALIYPNPAATHVDFAALDADEKKTHFRSIVASVNTFLAPYERIVDFAIIDRDLDAGRGELTPKLTPRRKIIETNFADVVRLLYRRAHLRVGGLDIVFPNWLFQALGLTAQDLQIDNDRLVLPGGKSLSVRRLQDGVALIGSAVYAHTSGSVALGVMLTTPRLWLGNDELVAFADLEPRLRERPGRAEEAVEWKGRVRPFVPAPDSIEALRAARQRADLDVIDVHHAALHLACAEDEAAFEAIHLLDRVLAREEGPLAEPARLLLARAAAAPSLEVRRRAFLALAPTERDARFAATLRKFLLSPGVLLDAETRRALLERKISEAHLTAFLAEAHDAARGGDASRVADRRLAALLRFIAEFGAAHPTWFRRLRAYLVRMARFGGREGARQEAVRAMDVMRKGFRAWLGPTARVGVDPETGQEYRWEDVVTFDEETPEPDRQRILSAIRDTAMLREAVFLFSGGAAPRLADLPPGGLSVRPLAIRPAKSVYRLTVQTRFQGHYDVSLNLVHDRPVEQIQEEIQYLVLCAETAGRGPLVEDFGGYWPEGRLWSEEFVTGETLDRALKRMARRPEEHERLRALWPYFAWCAMSAHVDFWNRLGREVELSDASMANIIVPIQDYQTGARIVSMSSVRPFRGLAEMLRFFRENFADPVERLYPFLEGGVRWNVVFSSLLEVVGEHEGLRMLREIAYRDHAQSENAQRDNTPGELPALPEGMNEALREYIGAVEAKGFFPMRLYFAIQRYLRWLALNPDPLPAARARMLQELYDTYHVQDISAAHPEARARFYRETVFREAPEPLANGLEEIIAQLRRREIVGDALVDAIADLRARIEVGPDEDYFLARLSFPYLRPDEAAGFVQTDLGGRHQSEIVVTLEDHDGDPFQVRHALNPKEVGRLHRLFLQARLDVRFRPEHAYLVALSERGQLIGGVYYEIEEGGRNAHLEKIVVAERYRKKGVADGLMREMFNRLRAQGAKTVTTGFFRPQYFYGYGFAIEKRYAGLVKNLEG